MLNLLPQDQSVSRRGCLQIGGLVGLGVSLSDALRQRAVAAAEGTPSRDVNCILIWTRGGTSHHDTFDPKPSAPLSVRGEFQTIDAATPGCVSQKLCPVWRNISSDLLCCAVGIRKTEVTARLTSGSCPVAVSIRRSLTRATVR